MKIFRRTVLLVAAFTLVGVLAVNASAARPYGAQDIGTFEDRGADSLGLAINDAGRVVGQAYIAFSWTPGTGLVALGPNEGFVSGAVAVNSAGLVTGYQYVIGQDRHAFLWTESEGMIDIGYPASTDGGYVNALALNSTGQVVGWSANLHGAYYVRAFSWTQSDGMVNLGTLGGTNSGSSAVNDAGEVVGFASVTGDVGTHAFAWTREAGMVDLGTLGGGYSNAQAINASGQVVGCSTTTGEAANHVFSWTQLSGMVDLGSLGGSCVVVAAINGAGQVVGVSGTDGDAARHAFLWAPAHGMRDLGTLGGSHSEATAVNSAGQVVGWSTTAGDLAAHAFSWTETGGMVDLGTLGGSESFAVGVNTGGAIVGWAQKPDGSTRAVVWREGYQAITFDQLPTKSSLDAPFAVSASSSSGLAVQFAVGLHDQCTISGNTITITGVGSCTVTASQPGNANYDAAQSVSRTFAIEQAYPATNSDCKNGLWQRYRIFENQGRCVSYVATLGRGG
jgi:probable HAF family extracellular repeat protein